MQDLRTSMHITGLMQAPDMDSIPQESDDEEPFEVDMSYLPMAPHLPSRPKKKAS
jgi:hypothetical protein